MTPHEQDKALIAQATWRVLDRFNSDNPDGAKWGAHAWLTEHGGMPTVAIMHERARSDALYWADTATPNELECYMVAAARKMAENADMMHSKQIKRVVAACWNHMSPAERLAFKAWIEQKGDGK